jgi:anti-sigma factor RsiW
MHVTEDDLVLHYYGELEPPAAARIADHLRQCAGCNGSFATLQRVLAAVDATPPVEVRDGFERTVWARLQPELDRGPRKNWFSWFVLSPARLAWVAAVVILVGAAFFAGRVSQKAVLSTTVADTTTASSGLRERVLLADLGEHLDRSQLMLTELVSADPADTADFAAQRERAQELVADNRLYRQTAAANGNAALAAVLDDLEQVLVDVAASPDNVSVADFGDVRQRIENKGLLLKVRVLSLEVEKRQKAQIRSRAGQSS